MKKKKSKRKKYYSESKFRQKKKKRKTIIIICTHKFLLFKLKTQVFNVQIHIIIINIVSYTNEQCLCEKFRKYID